jgi:hypothetical protein
MATVRIGLDRGRFRKRKILDNKPSRVYGASLSLMHRDEPADDEAGLELTLALG